MTYRLVLAAGSMLDCDADMMIDIAAGAGFEWVGLRLSGEHGVIDPAASRRRAHRLGVSVHDSEVHRIGQVGSDPIDLLDASASVGAAAVLVVSDLADRQHTVDEVGRLVEECRSRSMLLGLEYMAWTNPSTPAEAVEMAHQTGCVVVVDVLHHHRLGAGVAELEMIVQSGTLGWVQICDAPVTPRRGVDLVHEARHGRLPPGSGDLPLTEMLECLPDDATISIEVQSDDLGTIAPIDRAALLHDATHAALDRLHP